MRSKRSAGFYQPERYVLSVVEIEFILYHHRKILRKYMKASYLSGKGCAIACYDGNIRVLRTPLQYSQEGYRER